MRIRRSLTLSDRRMIERRWRRGDMPLDIAADLDVAPATVYRELKRGQDGTLDENARLAYSAELGQRVFQEANRRRGLRNLRGAANEQD